MDKNIFCMTAGEKSWVRKEKPHFGEWNRQHACGIRKEETEKLNSMEKQKVKEIIKQSAMLTLAPKEEWDPSCKYDIMPKRVAAPVIKHQTEELTTRKLQLFTDICCKSTVEYSEIHFSHMACYLWGKIHGRATISHNGKTKSHFETGLTETKLIYLSEVTEQLHF